MQVLKVNGKEFIVKYNFRALSELQDRGVNLTSEQEFKLKDIVTLLHVGLKKFQKEITLDETFDLMDDILEEMTLEELMMLLSDAMEKSMGKQKPNPMVK